MIFSAGMVTMDRKRRRLYVRRFDSDWKGSVAALLDAAELDPGGRRVVVKPNLVVARRPPVTTPVELVAAIVDWLAVRNPGGEIVVADGTGAAAYDTWHVFRELGYTEMADRKGVRLVDLNTEPLERLENPTLRTWPEFYLPRIVLESFLISVPVLKAHTLADVTLTMKNMMGAVPPLHYQADGHWKKSALHATMHESTLELNRYRTPDFTILDATQGMREAHLWGALCDPPPGLLVAGYDPVATDAYGAGLLGRDWREIGYIRDADGELGRAEPLEIIEL